MEQELVDPPFIRRFVDRHGEEKLLEIANLLMEKHALSEEIIDWLKDDKVKKAHEIYDHLLSAFIRRQWLRLKTPDNNNLAVALNGLGYGFEKKGVRVAPLADPDDVATHAAYMVSKLVLQIAEKQALIKIGFSGGNITRKVFRKLVQLVTEPSYSIPLNKIVSCHALVAGFDNEAPGTEPSAFFSYLDDCKTTFTKKFVPFHAPSFVPKGQLAKIQTYPAIKEAKDKAGKLDLIVTSAASFADEHSQLRKYYLTHQNARQGTSTKEDWERLHKLECIGDMLWLPLNAKGPLPLDELDHRPMALLELDDLPDRIAEGTFVLLVIGPCAAPRDPIVPDNLGVPPDAFRPKESCIKTGVLEAILNLQRNNPTNRHITHLVVDKGTAIGLIERVAPELLQNFRTGNAKGEKAGG